MGHWYKGDPVPGTCVPNTLPIDYRVPLPYGSDSRWVPKEVLGLVEGGGLPMMGELVKKYEEEEEEEEQGEQPHAASKAGPSEAPELVEVGAVRPSMLLAPSAQERWDAPTSRRDRGKECAVQVMPPPEMDEEMAQCLQV